jgi:hypothetical protein
MANPTCRILLAHVARRPASRAACTAGKSSASNTPMIAITTNSSTIVKARRACINAPQASIENQTETDAQGATTPNAHLQPTGRSSAQERLGIDLLFKTTIAGRMLPAARCLHVQIAGGARG